MVQGTVVDTVSALWRYPVKSMAGEQVTHLEIGPRGAVGDRAYAVVDAATDRVLTARRVVGLLDVRPRWCSDEVVLAFPDGTELAVGDRRATLLLGDYLGRAVRIEAPRPGRVTVLPYRRDPDDDSIVGEFDLLADTYFDTGQLHLLSTGSLRTGAALHPAGDWDVRRFRPNVLTAGADRPVEDDWIGDRIGLGTAEVEVLQACKRCVMVALPQAGLPKDSETMRSLFRARDAAFGVLAWIRRTGRVAVGDPLLVRSGAVAAVPRPAAGLTARLGTRRA